MRITKVNIPKGYDGINDGLEAINMDKLSQIVLIAGKNGAGKTRILKKIDLTLNRKPRLKDINYAKECLKSYEMQIQQTTENLTRERKSYERAPDINLSADISMDEEILRNLIITRDASRATIDWKEIVTTELSNQYSLIKFVPKQLALEDCNNFSKNALATYAHETRAIGVDKLPKGALAKIQVIQDKWYSATHQNSPASDIEKIGAIEDYDKLRGLLSIFLNTSIGRTINDDATLFGFPLGQASLSDGQKILLQFCMAVYSQNTELTDLMLVMDEPENHLHPSVIIEVINQIIKCVPNGQIWIATHSIPLLAHFDPSMIWFVDNGNIKHAGKIPGQVLSSLLGDESEIAKLQDFISLPAQFATSRYAFESLLEPAVVVTNSSDPQSRQIRKNLLKLAGDGKLRILDYGAGKGRLISNINEQGESQEEKLIDKIDYVAYDLFDTDKEICDSALARAYGSSENRYFNNFKDLLIPYNKGTFDVVIMCNVLHEINPNEWIKLFKADGTISKLLKEDGLLLLVEDQQIPVGEKCLPKRLFGNGYPTFKRPV